MSGEDDIREAVKKSVPASKSPNRVAAEILEKHRLVADATESVYRYENGVWRRLPKIALYRLAQDFDGGATTVHRRREIVDFLRNAVYEHDLTWGRVADHEVGCISGIVDVLTGEIKSHRPEYYLERVIPHVYDPSAEAPVWQAALADWFGDGEGDGSIEALQDFFGYMCLSHAKWKKALLLYGPADCGKSRIVDAGMGLVGLEYTCQLSIEFMDDKTTRAVIKGKALNVATELPTDALIADSGFKTMVSTEEPILIDEKYCPAEMYVPTAKHMIATNHLPRINDRTEATFNRLMLLPMLNSILPENQDRDLKQKIEAELPGIFAWAIEGAKRLASRGGEWREPESGRILMTEYKDEQNPIRQFLREECERAEGVAIPLASLTKVFNDWNAGARKVSKRVVGGFLRAALGKQCIKNVKVRTRSMKSLTGWRLSRWSDAPDELDLGAPETRIDELET